MARLNPESLFQSWLLSEQEFLQGSVLTSLQKQVVQNQISQVATQKLNLEYDASNPMKFLQEEASLKGQIQALQYLLTLSQTAEVQLDPGLQQVHISSDRNPQE